MIWHTRALLAALLLFGSEILLWTDPPARSVTGWLIQAGGYLALAALLLDLIYRFRVRDALGVMALAGVYGLLAGLFLNPETALTELPRTLISRVMGAHTLAGLLMLALLPGLAGRFAWVGVGAAGLAWGVWVRWMPALDDPIALATDLPALLVYGAGGLIVILALLATARPAGDARLGRAGWLVVAVLLALNWRGVDLFAAVVVLLLAFFCGLLLWSQARRKGGTFLDPALPPRFSLAVIGLALLFLAAGALGYSLPLDVGALTLFVGVFSGYGLVWLPGVSMAMGVRALRRLSRTRQL